MKVWVLSRRWAWIVATGLMSGMPASAQTTGDVAPTIRGREYATVGPMNLTVSRTIVPARDALMTRLLAERRALTIDGVRVFGVEDRFLPGKIARAMADRILELPDDDPRMAQRLKDFANIAAMTIDDPNDTWGKYYYIAALDSLRQRGLLGRALPKPLYERLRRDLDWRSFVRPDMTLIGLPNNFYGVAFSIARARNRLGWEGDESYRAMLARMLDHYRQYSGTYGFADETDGQGRFDRYSILLIGEIAHRLIETDLPTSPEVRGWLRRSVDLMLPRFNLRGEGFEYGRSIGAYGETAFLEVMTAAAKLKILTPQEERMAYAFSSRIAARYANFWLDPATGSVNLWDGGRRTDAYRGKHRILGENLSLARQQFYTNSIWNELGYRDAAPDAGYAAWLDRLPGRSVTWFARGRYDRLVVTTRDRGRVVSLPIINGAADQHMHNPYFPVPFSPGMLHGAADAGFPQLLPRITLGDGSVLMPLAYFEGVRVVSRGTRTEVRWRQRQLDRIGEKAPVPDGRVAIDTRYVLTPGMIVREDRIRPARGTVVTSVDIEFATFSDRPAAHVTGARFARGEVTGFDTSSYDGCTTSAATDPVYRSPVGAMRSVVRCRTTRRLGGGAVSVRWTLRYAPGPTAAAGR